MTEIQLLPEGLTLPEGLVDLQAFRAWARSPEFPERGRIDWVGGAIEADMSPEKLFSHGTLKGAIFRRLAELIEDRELGVVFTDRARISSIPGDVSAEPDVVVLLSSTLESGRARLVPAAPDGEVTDSIEIEGAPDLVVECVSRSSVIKDTQRLRQRYHAAGIPEYWIFDARKTAIRFQLLVSGEAGYVEVAADGDGWRRSPLLGRSVRVRRIPMAAKLVRYVLDVSE